MDPKKEIERGKSLWLILYPYLQVTGLIIENTYYQEVFHQLLCHLQEPLTESLFL